VTKTFYPSINDYALSSFSYPIFEIKCLSTLHVHCMYALLMCSLLPIHTYNS